MSEKRIVMLAGRGFSTNIVYNTLPQSCDIVTVVVEDRVSLSSFLYRRWKKLGMATLVGQLLFQALVVKPLSILSKTRIASILVDNGLNICEIPQYKITKVPSINSEEVSLLLKEIKPDLVIVNGTRIISREILSSVECPFVNMHAGITPYYRGVHGMYWALVNQDYSNCGVTVHLVDPGIDTGKILYTTQINATTDDNFVTYPYLQLASGVSLLVRVVQDAFSNNLNARLNPSKGKLWTHPTIWQYFYFRFVRGVK